MNFGDAMNQIAVGNKISSHAWYGLNMIIFKVPGSTFEVNRPPLLGIYPEGTKITYGAHIDMMGADGVVRPWTPSQADMDSESWYVVVDVVNDGDIPF